MSLGLKQRLLTLAREWLTPPPQVFPLGFGLTPVASGQTQIIIAVPQTNVRPLRLVIPSTIAADFMINDFKIGMRSQLFSPGAIPAHSFTEHAALAAMKFDVVYIGQVISLDVTNVVGVPELREVTHTPVHLKPRKGERKKAFEARYIRAVEAVAEVYRDRQAMAHAEHEAARAATTRNFTAALFCEKLEPEPRDGWGHVRQIARRMLDAVASP